MDIMSFVNNNPYYSLLEMIVTKKIPESRVMAFSRLKQLLNGDNEMLSQPRFFGFQIKYMFLLQFLRLDKRKV